ncbi:MAG: hydrogenase maturation nickel metallochaperone HypA [Candidatus Heimdallarchaeota archaeon]|nr:hydrogenase maturation nickel metallochaperone HypA [Candidatus Heimdallarchaeota archaeon]
MSRQLWDKKGRNTRVVIGKICRDCGEWNSSVNTTCGRCGSRKLRINLKGKRK